jgi:hypothetical protein
MKAYLAILTFDGISYVLNTNAYQAGIDNIYVYPVLYDHSWGPWIAQVQ